MNQISPKMPAIPFPKSEEGDGPDEQVSSLLPEGYVKSLNGGVGKGSIGAFDRIMAGAVSVKHRTGEQPKGRFDHLYGRK